MSLTIQTSAVKIINKWSKDFTNQNTNITTTYYNCKAADIVLYDNMVLSISEEVFKHIEEGKNYYLIGTFGERGNNKYAFFNGYKEVK